jgi:type I restriction enzyme S subunit
VQRNALDLGTLERYELSDEEVERWRLRAGDLLVVEGNGSETEIGRCAIWRGAVDPCVFQNHLIRVRPVFAAEAVEFLQLFLNSPDGVAEMKRLAITTSGLYNLSVGKIRNLAVPVPPLTEQHRIVARVEQLRRLCAELRERLQQTRATQSRLGDALVSAAAQSPSC